MIAKDVANYYVELASHIDENDLTNLKLQKILYFAQGHYLAKFGKPLFGEEIEAWTLGPVVKEVYNEFKSCGNFPITVFDADIKAPKVDTEMNNFLQSVWEKYGLFSAAYLVSLTHEENTPWKKFYVEGASNIIPKDEIAGYFSALGA